MGGRRRRWQPSGWSRRAVLRGIGALPSMFAAAGPAQAETPNNADGSARFVHGVASGDPLNDRVILWTRVNGVDPATYSVDYVVTEDEALSRVVAAGSVLADASADYCVHVDVNGLQPGRYYWYRFSCDGQTSVRGRTRTLPADAVTEVKLAVVSCASLAHGYFNAYQRVAELDPLDAVLHLGDYIYEVRSGQYGALRDYEPGHEVINLADYRQRYAQYRREPELQALHQRHPLIAIWDDHEFADDAWSGGARNHQADVEGSWSERSAAATQAWHEWLPVRRHPSGDPRRIERRFRFGQLAELFMLEGRLLGRDEQIDAASTFTRTPGDYVVFEQKGPFLNPKRQILGAAQQAWLFAGLRRSSARWKLIGQGSMMSQLKLQGDSNAGGKSKFLNHDQWDGYAMARKRLLDCLRGDPQQGQAAVRNAVVLSGDIHSSWAADLTQDPNNPDVASGGYNPETGEGAVGVEWVTTSVTAPEWVDLPRIDRPAEWMNPHIQYSELQYRGYLLLDVRQQRIEAQWWYVDSIEERSAQQWLGAAFQVMDGVPHVSRAGRGLPLPPPSP